jgi:hypothetical protein
MHIAVLGYLSFSINCRYAVSALWTTDETVQKLHARIYSWQAIRSASYALRYNECSDEDAISPV